MSTVLTLLQELSRAAVRETGVLAVLAMRVCAYVCGCSWIATPLRRHDMRVPTGSHFVRELRPVGWWGAMASHGVKRDVGHVSGGLWRVSSEHGCLLLRVEE